MHIKTYIGKLDKEIDELIHKEAKALSVSGETQLHILFENRCHAMELLNGVLKEEEPEKAVPLAQRQAHTRQ